MVSSIVIYYLRTVKWFKILPDCVLWHINPCRLSNAKFSLYEWAHADIDMICVRIVCRNCYFEMNQSLFVCTQLIGFNYCCLTQIILSNNNNPRKRLNSSIWPINRTLKGTTNLGQSEPGSNGNEGVVLILLITRPGASALNGLVSYPVYSW